MLTYLGLGLVALSIIMILPVSDENSSEIKFYGMATLVAHDLSGNEIFSQSIHNAVVNTGEDFILNQVFADGVAPVNDSLSVGSICITDDSSVDVDELHTAAFFDGNATASITDHNNCKQDAGQGVVSADGIATIGGLQFIADTGANNTFTGTTITGIGICMNETGDDNDYSGCLTGGAGVLFATVDTSNITLASGETVTITYTFDISS